MKGPMQTCLACNAPYKRYKGERKAKKLCNDLLCRDNRRRATSKASRERKWAAMSPEKQAAHIEERNKKLRAKVAERTPEEKKIVAEKILRCQKKATYRNDPQKLITAVKKLLLVVVDLNLTNDVIKMMSEEEEICDEFLTSTLTINN